MAACELPMVSMLSDLLLFCFLPKFDLSGEGIWERRKVKVSLERSPASRRLRSSVESLRTKIGGFMSTTVTHNPNPTLEMH
jgi:hypothetical protein